MRLDLSRMDSADGKNIGTQTISSNADQISWQCHVVENKHEYLNPYFSVIAVEPFSRYTLLIPYSHRPDQKELEDDLIHRWGNEMLHHMMDCGAVLDSDLDIVANQFRSEDKNISWYRNTDLSVNGHVADAEQWIRDYLDQYGMDNLDDDNAVNLGIHINRQVKRAKNAKNASGKRERFIPVPRFVDDGLFRFAKGMCECQFEHTPEGNYPKPWGDEPKVITVPQELPDNVVSLADYSKRR